MPYDIIIGRDEDDKKRFGDKGLVFLGKGFVTMGNYTSLSNPIYLDVARSHVILVSGKRGSGKSYTLGVIAEELSNLPEDVSKNLAPLIFDTMGIFWTMKYRNDKEKELLQKWDLKPKDLPVKIFVPQGFVEEYEKKGLKPDKTFSIKPSELKAEDWILTFELDILQQEAVLIQAALSELRENYGIDKIIEEIENQQADEKTKNTLISLFKAAKTWGIFSEKGLSITELINAGKTTVLDLSMFSSISAFNIRSLVIGLITKRIFNERMKERRKEEISAVSRGQDFLTIEDREFPLVWLFIDEAHEFLPEKEQTAATAPLMQVLREGRQPGLSIVLATQQPGQIHKDVMTQSDIVISHRVTARPDVTALNNIMQSYLLKDIKNYLDNLPDLKGSAIILDDNSERIYPMRVRPRFTWHGGEAPTSVKVEKRI